MNGQRLRTIAERLYIKDNEPAAIDRALSTLGKTWREVILAAATGSTEGAPSDLANRWKSHARDWFKSEKGGQELAEKMITLEAWKTIGPQLLPLFNALLHAAGRPALQRLEL